MADKLGKLYVLVEKNEDGTMQFYRGNPDGKRWNSGKRRNIRVFPSLGLAKAALKQNSAPDNVFIEEFVIEDMAYRDPYSWEWPEFENILDAFDTFDVSFSDGAVHPMFGGSSGSTVLRVTDVSPQKQAGGKTVLHISTDTNWFGPGVNRIFSDDHIDKTIDEQDLTDEQKAALKKAFGTGREALPRYAPEKR